MSYSFFFMYVVFPFFISCTPLADSAGIDTDPGHTAPIGTDQGRGHLIIPVDALGHHVPADIKQRQLLTNAKQYILWYLF